MREKKSKNDLLKSFLENETNKSDAPKMDANVEYIGNNTRQKVDHIEVNNDFTNVPLNELSMEECYEPGTLIFVRPAKTAEIESFSVVNENNPYDVKLKLNELLSACLKINFPDGTSGTFRDVFDKDRDPLVIFISRLTIDQGRELFKTVKCSCNNEVKIEFVTRNYIFGKIKDKYRPFFDKDDRKFRFPLENGDEVVMRPPTIGLTQDIHNYVLQQVLKNEIPNVSFMTNLGWIKHSAKSLDMDTLLQEEYNFSKMNKDKFAFINEVQEDMELGIREVKCRCTCGQEVRTNFTYPNGARALFVVRDAFGKFIKKSV